MNKHSHSLLNSNIAIHHCTNILPLGKLCTSTMTTFTGRFKECFTLATRLSFVILASVMDQAFPLPFGLMQSIKQWMMGIKAWKWGYKFLSHLACLSLRCMLYVVILWICTYSYIKVAVISTAHAGNITYKLGFLKTWWSEGDHQCFCIESVCGRHLFWFVLAAPV